MFISIKSRTLVILALSLSCFLLSARELPSGVKGPNIKIRIAKSLDKILVEGLDLSNKIHQKGLLKKYSGRNSLSLDCMRAKGKSRVMLATLSSSTGLISLSDQKYHGDLHIVSSEDGDCDVVNETNLENYIGALLSKEMNAVWPIEALKAQAVAARSYAYYKMKYEKSSSNFYDIENSEKHQVVGDFFDITQTTMKAAMTTKGEILVTDGGEMTPIFFHAKCGGRTLRPDQVWENKVKGYESVVCPFCKGHGGAGWKLSIDSNRMEGFAKWYANRFKKVGLTHLVNVKEKIFLAPDKENTTTLRLYIGEKVYLIEKPIFRRYFGRLEIPSNNFVMNFDGKSYTVAGEGNGHSVGMCQLGALDLADRGQSYKEILSFYFPNHKIKQIY